MGFRLEFAVKPHDCIIDLTGFSVTVPVKLENSYDDVKAVFEKTHAKIMSPYNFIEIQSDGNVCIYPQKELDKYKNLMYTAENGDTESFIGGKAKSWLTDPAMRTYNKMVLKPPPLSCADDEFNIWIPFKWVDHTTESGDTTKINELISIICNHDDPTITYFTNWLA